MTLSIAFPAVALQATTHSTVTAAKRNLRSQRLIFTFGAKQLLKDRALTGELRDHFPGATMIGGSTSGEIAGDEVTDDSLVATVIGFDYTRVRRPTRRSAMGSPVTRLERSLLGS
jgi:hypothetical protein